MTQPKIPDKLYFKIGEVAKMASLPTHVLRYWESEFSAIKPKRTNSKQRLYRREDVELIFTIKSLLHEQGYTIAGARKLIDSGNLPEEVVKPQPNPSPSSGKTVSVETLQMIKKELVYLQKLLSTEAGNRNRS